MSPIDRRVVRVFDWPTLLLLAAILAVGVVLVASASTGQDLDLARRQAAWAVVGLLFAAAIGLVDYRHLTDNAYPLWGLALVALAAVLLFAPSISGARSWFRIGSVGIQPSEFAKVVTILALARAFADREPRPFGLRGVLAPALLVAAPAALTAMQPDQGTAATFLPPLLAVAFVAGLRVSTLAWLGAAGAAAAPLWYLTLQGYQRARLTSFLHPEADLRGAGYQLVQSKIAIGSGGLLGKGLFSGTQSQLNFLPEQENDFIMALMGEELGFVGVALLLTLYLWLILRLLRGAALARDRAGAYTAVGVAALLAFHLVINVGMVIGYVPITGIPLPLLSYGGSSVLATSMAVGTVISVRSRRFVV